MFANVIIEITQEKLDRAFQYKIPDTLLEKIAPGVLVEIPFGNGNRLIQGYVIEVTDLASFDEARMKEISRVIDKGIPVESQLISLAAWIRKNYGGTMIQALKTVLPVKKEQKEKETKTLRLCVSKEVAEEERFVCERKKYTAKERLLKELIEQEILSYEVVTSKLNITKSVIDGLVNKGFVRVETKRIYRNPVKDQMVQEKAIELNKEQQSIVSQISKEYEEGSRKTYLLHGVTGSGKTEVYIALIKMAIAHGKQAIVLIPEIALTYQTVMRFYRSFGDRVSIMNSKLSQGERFDQFTRAQKGDIDIIIGPRSALFVPFQNLGFIIIDEEHESTYKSETIPKYHARETAIERARQTGASVLLGSATPSLEAFYKANEGEYTLFSLQSRVEERALPIVHTIDLREELKRGNRSILSDKLRELMADRLCKGEQMMLFINRRGWAGFVSCRACGHVMKCPHCDVSLSAHNNGKLVCHYCGYEEALVKQCPACGSSYIGGMRAGTQQIEEVVKREYPFARVLRMDMDTTKEKDGHAKILAAFANQEADVLIGTQMIVKGHDFPKVTLVGVLAADMSLYANDYHASERTFQLLTQAAGRAGRGLIPGEVVIQTYNPEHFSVVSAQKQDYLDFYEQEITYRSLLGYPPVANMMAILLVSHKEEEADLAAEKLVQVIKEDKNPYVQVIGPVNASISKINDIYRKVIYCKHQQYDVLVQIKDRLEQMLFEQEAYKQVNVQFDFNPMNTY